MKKKTKAKKKPVGAPLEGSQTWQCQFNILGGQRCGKSAAAQQQAEAYKAWGPGNVIWYGDKPKTDSERIADLEKKVERLEGSKADKPKPPKEGAIRVRVDEAGDYHAQQYSNGKWGHISGTWTCRAAFWTSREKVVRAKIERLYGTMATVLPGRHHE